MTTALTPMTVLITRSKSGAISVAKSNNQNRPLGFHSNPFGGLEFALTASSVDAITPEYAKSVFDLYDTRWHGAKLGDLVRLVSGEVGTVARIESRDRVFVKGHIGGQVIMVTSADFQVI